MVENNKSITNSNDLNLASMGGKSTGSMMAALNDVVIVVDVVSRRLDAS